MHENNMLINNFNAGIFERTTMYFYAISYCKNLHAAKSQKTHPISN